MDLRAARQQLHEARAGYLATVTRDGLPHVVPCCFVLVGDTIYTAVDSKPKSTAALRRLDNIRSRPRACLLADRYDEDWSQLWWVRVDGAARVIEDEIEQRSARASLVAKYEQYRRVEIVGPYIAIDIDRWRSWP